MVQWVKVIAQDTSTSYGSDSLNPSYSVYDPASY